MHRQPRLAGLPATQLVGRELVLVSARINSQLADILVPYSYTHIRALHENVHQHGCAASDTVRYQLVLEITRLEANRQEARKQQRVSTDGYRVSTAGHHGRKDCCNLFARAAWNCSVARARTTWQARDMRLLVLKLLGRLRYIGEETEKFTTNISLTSQSQ